MNTKPYWLLLVATNLSGCGGGAEGSPTPSSGGIPFTGEIQLSPRSPTATRETAAAQAVPEAEASAQSADAAGPDGASTMASAGTAEDMVPSVESTQGSENAPLSPASGAVEADTQSTAAVQGEDSSPPASVSEQPTFPEGSTPRIMIVGDSISAGPGCYKGELVTRLRNAGLSAFQFVGEYSDDCGAGVMHSAVSCSTAEHYTQPSFTMSNCFVGEEFDGMAALVATHQPDLLMLQLGVNDVWNGRSTADIVADYEELVRQARANNPAIVVAVAQIQQIRPDCDPADSSVFDRAQNLVDAVPQWAEAAGTPESPVFVVDLWTNSDWSQAETTDCVHPNEVGAARMADNWFTGLRAILSVAR